MAGLFSRLFGRRPEERRDPFFGSVSLGQSFGISPRQAETVATVSACLSLICNAIGSLPPSLVVEGANGRTPAPRTASAWALLRRPNAFMSWAGWAHWTAWQLLAHGNAVSALGHDGRGSVNELRPISWPSLSPQMIVSAAGQRRMVYDVLPSATAETAGLPKRLLDGDVLHVRSGHTESGIIGAGILRGGSGPIDEAQQIEAAASATWRNGLRPSAVLSSPTYLTTEQRARKDQFIASFSGALRQGAVPLIEGGWELKPFGQTNSDAQVLETRSHVVADIARLFNIPEPLLQIGARALTDPTPHLMQFAALALQPLVVQIENEFSSAVLGDQMALVLDMSSMMRGSFSQIAAAFSATTQSAITTANDARRAMGLEPHPGGDGLGRGSAPTWPADAPGMPHLGPSPGPRGDAPPEPGTNQNAGRGNGKMPLMQ